MKAGREIGPDVLCAVELRAPFRVEPVDALMQDRRRLTANLEQVDLGRPFERLWEEPEGRPESLTASGA
jgi:hypothetical protein